MFNDNSRIVAIKTSGNVFAAEAVEELNFKAKGWNDLLTGEAFVKRVNRSSLCLLQAARRDWCRSVTYGRVREGLLMLASAFVSMLLLLLLLVAVVVMCCCRCCDCIVHCVCSWQWYKRTPNNNEKS